VISGTLRRVAGVGGMVEVTMRHPAAPMASPRAAPALQPRPPPHPGAERALRSSPTLADDQILLAKIRHASKSEEGLPTRGGRGGGREMNTEGTENAPRPLQTRPRRDAPDATFSQDDIVIGKIEILSLRSGGKFGP